MHGLWGVTHRFPKGAGEAVGEEEEASRENLEQPREDAEMESFSAYTSLLLLPRQVRNAQAQAPCVSLCRLIIL